MNLTGKGAWCMWLIDFALPRLCVVCGTGFLSLLATFHHSPPVFAQQGVPPTITIPDGTLIPLYLMDDLSSKKNKADDPVRFKVRENVRNAMTKQPMKFDTMASALTYVSKKLRHPLAIYTQKSRVLSQRRLTDF